MVIDAVRSKSPDIREWRALTADPTRGGTELQFLRSNPMSDPMTDVKIRKEWMNSAINRQDPALFAEHLIEWLEATSFLQSRNVKARPETAIPRFSKADFKKDSVKGVADDAVFAFCMAAALQNNGKTVADLQSKLAAQFGNDFPGWMALICCLRGTETGNALDDAVGQVLKGMIEGKALDPKDIWTSGLRLLEKSRKSNFVQELVLLVAKWHRTQWGLVINKQRFNLTNPRATVPPIEEALGIHLNDQPFIANLLLSAAAAVDLELDEAYQHHLKSIARRA
jgi:hypothetical protein